LTEAQSRFGVIETQLELEKASITDNVEETKVQTDSNIHEVSANNEDKFFECNLVGPEKPANS
jgi:hypothetical protein